MPNSQRFTFDRSCIRKLAGQRQVQVALQPIADAVAQRARQGDPQGNYHPAPVVVTLANLARAGIRVQDTAPRATQREFGAGRAAGRRTLGRLSQGRE